MVSDSEHTKKVYAISFVLLRTLFISAASEVAMLYALSNRV